MKSLHLPILSIPLYSLNIVSIQACKWVNTSCQKCYFYPKRESYEHGILNLQTRNMYNL